MSALRPVLDAIRPGDKVTIVIRAGVNVDGTYDTVRRTGRAVMRGPHGWVLNMGGRYGTPGIATKNNDGR